MQSVSADFLAAVHNSGRQFKSMAVVIRTGYDEITYDDSIISSISRKDAVVSGKEFEIGSVVSATCEIVLKNLDGSLSGIMFQDAEIRPSIGVLLESGQYEYCPLGKFYVDSVEKADGEVRLSCYDGMVKLEELYQSSLTYPAMLLDIANEIASNAGLSLKYGNFQNCLITVPTAPGLAGTTLRQALSWVAEAAGCFARINREGLIDIDWYSKTSEAATVNNYYELNMADTGCKPYDGVIIKVSDDDMNGVKDGTCNNPYQIIANPLLTQNQSSAIEAIYKEFNGFTYIPYEATWQGNPALDAGDKIVVTGKDGAAWQTIITNSELYYDGGVKSIIKAVSQKDISATSPSGTLTSTVKKVTRQQTNIKNLMTTNFSAVNASIQSLSAEKADVDSLNAAAARISTLETNSATVQQLNAANANITDLQANKANVTDLNTTNANITNLQANKLNVTDAKATYATITNLNAATGQIGTLESDNATIVNLLSSNAGIENLSSDSVKAAYAALAAASLGDAQITKLTAAAITSGSVDTSKVTIEGENSRLKISGNRLQVFAGTDNPYERVVLGDVNNDGSDYGLRVRGSNGTTVLLDENGVTKEGFTDGYGKLADNSLNAAKIDRESIVTQVNGATSNIQGSKVYLDNQALDVAFSNISDTVTSQGSKITTQSNEITATAKAIGFNLDTEILSTTGGLSTLGDLKTFLSANQGKITSAVSEADITNAVNNIQVGGRNLWIKTSASNNYVSVNGTLDAADQQNMISDFIAIDATEPYEYSFWGTILSGSNSWTGWCFYDVNKTFVGSRSVKTESAVSADTYSHYSYTITVPTEIKTAVKYIRIGSRYLQNSGLAKFELGNKATDWTPAPEDVQTQIDTHSSEISQNTKDISLRLVTSQYNSDQSTLQNRMSNAESNLTLQAGEISSKVDKNGIVSAINQSAESVSINASKLNLSGYVTVTNLSTAGATTINGSNITTGTISADRIDTANLYAARLNSSSGYYAAIGKGSLNNDNYGLQLYNSSGAAMGELMLRSEDTNADASVGLLAQQDLYLGVNNYNTYIQVDGISSGTISLNAGTINLAGITNIGKLHCSSGYPHIYGDGTYLQLAHENNAAYGVVLQEACFRPAHDGWTTLGTSAMRWNQIYSTNSVISTSDRKEKNTIAPLDKQKSAKFIMTLNPVSYKFNDGESGRTHYGMVSQDVEEELCCLNMTPLDFAGFIKSPQDDGLYRYGLRYEEFIAPLISAVQYQNDRTGNDEARICVLESKLTSVQSQMAELYDKV